MELEEDVKIYLEDNYERINVPVPQFGGGDPADIIHDFQRVRPARGWGGGRERVSQGTWSPPSTKSHGKEQAWTQSAAVPCASFEHIPSDVTCV